MVLLLSAVNISSFTFSNEQVVEMLKTYLEKAGQDEEAELGGLLETFSERLTINQNSNNNNSSTNSDMENSVRQLLASLTALNLKKESDNWLV